MIGRLLATALVAIFVTAVATSAFATTIVQHQGSTTPSTEGWSWYSSGTGVTTGPVINDSGKNAYFTQDSDGSGSGLGSWRCALSTTQASYLQNKDWTLTVDMRVVGSSVPVNGTVAIYLSYATKSWQLMFGSTAAGNAIVSAMSGQTYTSTTGGYHTYELRYDSQTGSADLYVDGADRIGGWTGDAGYDIRLLSWGAAATPSTGRGNWSSVKLAYSDPLPVLGITNRAASATATGKAKARYRFRLWGKVTRLDADSFTLDDGSGSPVRVLAAAHGLSNGNYAAATGLLDNTTSPPTLASSHARVQKISN